MKVYTKKGDGGNTSLANGMSVSKADDRIELIGTIDELNSYIGHAKVLSEDHLKTNLAEIQRTLMKIMAAVADPRNLDYRMSAEETVHLEDQIDELEAAFPRARDFVLYGGCELSARLDIARAVTRRAERRFRKVAQNYGADAKAMQYVNRLADYLKKIGVFHQDFEAQYQTTTDFVSRMFENNLRDIEPYWVCLPMGSRCAVSNYQMAFKPCASNNLPITAGPNEG